MLDVQDIVEEGLISSAQLECVVYANMRFNTDLSADGDPHCALLPPVKWSVLHGVVHGVPLPARHMKGRPLPG